MNHITKFGVLFAGVLLLTGCTVLPYKNDQVKSVQAPVFDRATVKTGDAEGIDSWKTYRNEKYGYEFQYPSDWEMSLGEGPGNDARFEAVKLSKVLCCQFDFAEGMTLSIFYTSNAFPYPAMEQALAKKMQSFSADAWTGRIYKKLNKFDGIRVVQKQPTSAGFEEHHELYLRHDGGFFTFVWDIVDYQNKKRVSPDYLEKILSTFKFAEDDSANVKDWETYHNKKYWYVINYPRTAVLATDDAALGAKGHQVVREFSPMAPYITIQSGSAFVSICGGFNCPGYGPGVKSESMEEWKSLGGRRYKAQGFFEHSGQVSSKWMSVNWPYRDINVTYGYSSEYGKPLNESEIKAANEFAAQVLASFSLMAPSAP